MKILEAENLRKIYQMGTATVNALDGVDLSVAKGEMVAVVGRSGSGKSTLMNVLGCMDREAQGSYKVMGRQVLGMRDRELSRIRRDVFGFVFQNFNLIPSLSALENVELALHYRGVAALRRREMAQTALEKVGLAERMSHKPSQLSGGQQQRVAIARAIAADPMLILADEPTGNLDTASAANILELLQKLNKDGKTILVVTHDMKLAGQMPRSITLADGRII
ncbi:MAG: ABC transporter ATP-binding protein [Clostridia bacterium]|nr:ABC transporter ATP-binding protein [Clostridia bacterium]